MEQSGFKSMNYDLQGLRS